MTPHEYLEGSDLGAAVFDAVGEALTGFDVGGADDEEPDRLPAPAWLRLPVASGEDLTSPQAEVVPSIALDREVDSPRFKEVAHLSKGIQHHLETTDVDDEVRSWLHEAHEAAG